METSYFATEENMKSVLLANHFCLCFLPDNVVDLIIQFAALHYKECEKCHEDVPAHYNFNIKDFVFPEFEEGTFLCYDCFRRKNNIPLWV